MQDPSFPKNGGGFKPGITTTENICSFGLLVDSYCVGFNFPLPDLLNNTTSQAWRSRFSVFPKKHSYREEGLTVYIYI